MKKLGNILFLFISLIFFTTFIGCARVGYDFDTKNVQNIKINETTKRDLIDMFGQPWRKGIENGTTLWTYGHYTYRLIGDTGTKDLVIKFTDDGKVKSYTFNKTLDQR